jgi:DNA-binding PadR family transcriptional regulator
MRHHHHQHHRSHHQHAREDGFFEHLARHFGGRPGHGSGRGGRGLGGFGGFMEDGGPGGRGMRTGRKLSSGDLQLLVLALLADKPRHGYEIIRVLEERSQGFYSPSPSMVYPALTYLEEIGYATVAVEGARKLYSVTAEGQSHLAANQSLVDAMFEQFDRIGERMDSVRKAFADEPADEAGRGHFDLGRGGSEEIWQARSELKAAMIDSRGGSPEEQKRIAEILRRAAAEIRGGSGEAD